jgi:hypothetical protein
MHLEEPGRTRPRIVAFPQPSDDGAGDDHLPRAEFRGNRSRLPQVLELIGKVGFEFSDQPGALTIVEGRPFPDPVEQPDRDLVRKSPKSAGLQA